MTTSHVSNPHREKVDTNLRNP